MKTVIWDFNGTIIDDTQLCLDIENEMLRERGMKAGFTMEQYREMFCFPVIDYYYKLGYRFDGEETYDDISVQFNQEYARRFAKCRLIPGFEEKIRESIGKGYQNVIVSASRQDNLEHQCEVLGISSCFQELIGTSDLLAHGKIDRARRWLVQSGVEPEECLYIGDTTHDMETAEALGIEDYTLVACGHQSRRHLLEKTDRVVDTLAEVRL